MIGRSLIADGLLIVDYRSLISGAMARIANKSSNNPPINNRSQIKDRQINN
jgi:hypothetical protein